MTEQLVEIRIPREDLAQIKKVTNISYRGMRALENQAVVIASSSDEIEEIFNEITLAVLGRVSGSLKSIKDNASGISDLESAVTGLNQKLASLVKNLEDIRKSIQEPNFSQEIAVINKRLKDLEDFQ